jgi:hypothetical protein
MAVISLNTLVRRICYNLFKSKTHSWLTKCILSEREEFHHGILSQRAATVRIFDCCMRAASLRTAPVCLPWRGRGGRCATSPQAASLYSLYHFRAAVLRWIGALNGEAAMRNWTFKPSTLSVAVFALSCAAISLANAGAHLKGYARNCADAKELCVWHKAIVTPPKGWLEDEGWTARYQRLTLFENGDKSSSKPLIYLRAHRGDSALVLEDYIRVAQKRWKESAEKSSIEVLPDFVRKGKPAFKVYLYKNPAVPDQAFELTAFTKDADADHPQETYFFQAVLSSPSMEEVERTKAAFYELLSNL